jgi:hypothetical protein
MQIGKETVKISLFADNMILYLKDLKDTTNSFRNTAGYKINLAFYTPRINKLRKNI